MSPGRWRKVLLGLVVALALLSVGEATLGLDRTDDPRIQTTDPEGGSTTTAPADGSTTTAPGSTTTTAPGGAGAEEEEGGESVSGRLREVDDEGASFVEGADLTALDEAGEEVGTASSDAQGRWEIPLPGPGTYRVELDLDSLPDGVGVTEGKATVEGDTAVLEVTIAAGQSRPVLFPLGEGISRGDSLTRKIAQRTVDGVQFGLLIAMGAIGLSLIYGTTGLVNFAHGEMVTWGAITCFYFNQYVFGGLPLIPATVGAVIMGAVLGFCLDRGIFRPLRGRGTSLVAQMVITIGLAFLLRNIFLYLFGERPRPLSFDSQKDISIWVVSVNPTGLAIMGISVVVLAAVGIALQRTRMGKAMRAVADNRDLAESSGIDVQRIITMVWCFGGALAALAGSLVAMDERVKYDLGFRLLLLIFAGVTLGGLGTAFGAFAGSVIVGVFVNLSTIILPTNLKNVGALLVLILILMVRPQGIFGRAERVG